MVQIAPPRLNLWGLRVLGVTSVLSFYLFLSSTSFLPSGHVQRNKTSVEDVIKNDSALRREFRSILRPGALLNSTDRVEELARWTKALVSSTSSFLKSSKPKRILVFGGMSDYYGTDGRIQCPSSLTSEEVSLLSSQCSIHEDQSLTPTNILGFDALVSVRNWKPVIYEHRIPNLKHVLYIQESPFVTRYADLSVNNAVLASYWSGSDVVLPYGYFQPNHQNQNRTSNKTNYAQGKVKLAAIVVSNCEAINDRLSYVQALQAYVNVDIYGSCGNLPCEDNCFTTIKRDYKFYLSFEKANCRDYITEKFWDNALKHDIVPVVLGAHPDDYRRLAPQHSYIHVEDFGGPKKLGEYLTWLDKNDEAYNAYFDYKEKGRLVDIWSQFFCRLCSYLFYQDIIAPGERPVWGKGTTWAKANACLERNRWFWKSHPERLLPQRHF